MSEALMGVHALHGLIGSGGGITVRSLQRGRTFDGLTEVDIPIDPVDLSEAVLIVEARGDTRNSQSNAGRLVAVRLTSTTNIRAERVSTNGSMLIDWTVVELAGASVQNLWLPQTSEVMAVPIDPVDPSSSIVIGGGHTTEVFGAAPHTAGKPLFELTAADELTVTVDDADQIEHFAVQVVQL